MKKYILLIGLFTQMATYAEAQGGQNIWTFGSVGIDFNGIQPANYSNNLFPAYEGAASVCNATGQMLFYTNGYWVWNRNHEIMPELTGGMPGYTSAISPSVGYPPLMPWNGGYATQATAIAGVPAHPDRYYVFSLTTSGQLFYSMVDMTMNAGLGGIVLSQKSRFLAAGLTEKLTVVKGCNNIWVMTRSKTANQYKAFEINDTGIVTTPVISSVGNLPSGWYRYGVIKFSSNGQKMAAACNEAWNTKGGLELYDFDPHTGILSNAITLDSGSTSCYYYGACFSPDNSKLYASTSSFSYLNVFTPGKVHQFDLSAGTVSAIIASHSVVFYSSVYVLDNLGDLKRAKDGKIYFGSGQNSMHCITAPNLAGAVCNVVANAFLFPSGDTYRGLPNDVALIPQPDSVYAMKAVVACFKDSIQLIADTGKLYHWDNGAASRCRTVSSEGIYVVSYINGNCEYETDSFHVHFMTVPQPYSKSYSCPGKQEGMTWLIPRFGDTTTFTYTWQDADGSVLQQKISRQGDSLKGLDTGRYQVRITGFSGCDTTLTFLIHALPVPEAFFVGDVVFCKDAPVSFTNASVEPICKWFWGDGNSSTLQHPTYYYTDTGKYIVSLVVTNIEGCSDTVTREIEVKGFQVELVADKIFVNKEEAVKLQSSGSEPYTVIAWQPSALFPNQSSLSQTIAMDATRTFEVQGLSADGCKDTASVTVEVLPQVFMPTAFSPNGDGLNDRFRPVSTGYIVVRFFEVYNRFGQKVFEGYGKAGAEGWDGTFNGRQQDLGTYYYQINIEVNDGATIQMKGDVILLR